MKITAVPITECEPWEKNPRNIRKRDFERLKRQLQDLGQFKPLIAERINGKYIILGGNMRIRALQDLGFQEVNIILVKPKDEATRIKIALADNDRAGEYDDQALAELIYEHADEIQLHDYKIDVGKQADLETVLTAYGPEFDQAAEDKVPEISEDEPITKPGEIFQLGLHRLMCGDSTSPVDATALMAGEKAGMVFTDPPYNVAYKGRKHDEIMGDDQTEEEFIEFCVKFVEQLKHHSAEGAAFYICSGYSSYPAFLYAIRKNGLTFSCPIIWVKNNTSLGWGDYRHKHEMMLKARKQKRKSATPILYGWNGGRHYFKDGRFEADVWEIKRVSSAQMVHPTQKPLAIIRRALRNSSKRGELVLDLFGGSGATLIAAEQEGRRAYIMDLDPRYCDVIIRRWASWTNRDETDVRGTALLKAASPKTEIRRPAEQGTGQEEQG